jgi:hypothetical protein
MNELTKKALSRTFLLMRDDLVAHVDDDTLLAALTQTRVSLVADAENLSTHSAQTAFVTAAMLLARSGHSVHLIAPDVPLVGAQPPLRGTRTISALLEVGLDMIPGLVLSYGPPQGQADIAILFGSTSSRRRAKHTIALNATKWTATTSVPADAVPWREAEWPFGALAGAAHIAAEVFKCSMRKLRQFAKFPQLFDEFFAPSKSQVIRLAPDGARFTSKLADFDLISAGAISNAAIFSIARIRGVSAFVRTIDDDLSELSNLNRYMLLRNADLSVPKVKILSSFGSKDFRITGFEDRYVDGSGPFHELARAVLVGVDHIPTRWAVQRASPQWITIGATTHWSAMASFHHAEGGCSGCLHPYDDPETLILPTVAFVSFWAGLMSAMYLVRHAAGDRLAVSEQQTYLTPFRPDGCWRSPVAKNPKCPLACSDDVQGVA